MVILIMNSIRTLKAIQIFNLQAKITIEKSNVEKTQAEVAAKFPQVRLRRATSSLPTNSPTQEAIRKFEQGFYAERLNSTHCSSLGRRPNKAPTYRRGSAQPQERLRQLFG